MKKRNPLLRPIRPDDQDFLYQLYASTREQELAVTDWNEPQKETFLTMQFQAQHQFYQEHFSQAVFDVVELAGKPIGRLYVDRRTDEIRIIDIALLPTHRNQGLGQHLLQQLLDEAKQAKRPLRIHVEHFNPALKFYERLGFVNTGDNGVYYLMEANQVNTAS